jgi:hypothetical protein
VAVATVLVVATRPGPPTRQLAGSWTDGAGDTYDFAAGASNIYTASQVWGGSLHCYHADDITVTGNDDRYKGSIKLYPAHESSCLASIRSATITIVVAANGASAQVTTAGNDCGDCTTRTWNRAGTLTSPSQNEAAG